MVQTLAAPNWPQHTPTMGGGGHLSLATSGAAFVAFADQAARQVTIVNNTGTDIEVQQDGAGVALPIVNGSIYPFFGIGNASQLAVRRIDLSAVAVTVKARWEA